MKHYHKDNCSITLKNSLEQDHYNTTRDFFTKMGVTEKNIKQVKDFFSHFDNEKEGVVEDCIKDDMNPEYVEFVKDFTTQRAYEIVEAAAKDTKPSNNESTPKQWQRVRS